MKNQAVTAGRPNVKGVVALSVNWHLSASGQQLYNVAKIYIQTPTRRDSQSTHCCAVQTNLFLQLTSPGAV